MSMVYDTEHPVPIPPIIWDNMGYWEGINRHELVFQRCKECGTWRHPPRPVCPKCRSFEKEWAPSTGKGAVYSWVTYQESPHPGFKAPYSVVLLEMEEGVRLVSNMVDIKPEEISIGMPVEVVFEDIAEGLTLPKFRKVG
ncbi:MAG: Zn-ribbon domain-containing OB-fold protein [Dehalococcoidia bacterium]|nr:Zn-ribbon domain-containing OB-fold protein [Dehalococcoidia bacterium]